MPLSLCGSPAEQWGQVHVHVCVCMCVHTGPRPQPWALSWAPSATARSPSPERPDQLPSFMPGFCILWHSLILGTG